MVLEVHHSLLKRRTLSRDVIASSIDTASLIHLVAQVERVTVMNHQVLEELALLLEFLPTLLIHVIDFSICMA